MPHLSVPMPHLQVLMPHLQVLMPQLQVLQDCLVGTGKCGTVNYYKTYTSHYGILLDTLEGFQTIWKVSGHSGKFPDTMECFLTLWNFPRPSEVPGHSGKFPDPLKILNTNLARDSVINETRLGERPMAYHKITTCFH